MPIFHYTATNENGASAQGQIHADSQELAWQLIERQGLKPLIVAEESPPQATLTVAESAEIVEQVVAIVETKLPVEVGLRAAAGDVNRRSVAAALNGIADEIERGVPLDVAVRTHAAGFPRFLRGLVAAAAHTGQLAATLEECLTLQRDIRSVWRSLWLSLIYPFVVLAMVASVMLFLFLFVVPDFRVFFEEFGLELPPMTIALFRISDAVAILNNGIHSLVALGVLAGFVVVLVSLRLVVGSPNWRWLIGTVPLVGPLWSWSSAAAFAKLLGLLVEHQLPLPEALALVEEGVEDANVQAACREFARDLAGGSRLSELIAASHRLPQSLVPFVRAGETEGELPDALRTASDIFFQRLRLRALLLRSVSPPIIFILVSLTILVAILGLVLPLFDLITALA